MKYVVFKTRWGWFGLLAGEQGIVRTSLPVSSRTAVLAILLKGCETHELDKLLYKPLQDRIVAYFEGKIEDCESFKDIFLGDLPPFTLSVLTACRSIPYGRTSTYSALAAAVGRPKAVRAVANALARNPVPLIVPCHRIVRSDGQIGGFSAPGGSRVKSKLIDLEKHTLAAKKGHEYIVTGHRETLAHTA